MATVKKASNDEAQEYPSLLYICVPNNGKAAVEREVQVSTAYETRHLPTEWLRALVPRGNSPANMHRTNALLARAEAAYKG